MMRSGDKLFKLHTCIAVAFITFCFCLNARFISFWLDLAFDFISQRC